MAITKNTTNGIVTYDKFNRTAANNVAPKNLFVAAGNITVSSPDGITWTTRSSGVVPAGAGAVGIDNNNNFRIFNTSNISTSPDAITWTTGPNNATWGTNANFTWYRGLAYTGGGTTFSWALNYQSGQAISGDRAAVNNGTWFVTTSSTAPYSLTVVPASGGASTTVSPFTGINQAQGLAFGNGIWVGCPVNRLWYTTDSSARTGWTNSGTTFGAGFNRVKFVNGVFFVFESGTTGMSRSTDGLNWTSCTISLAINDIAFGNGKWVAAAANGSVGESTDGVTFTTRSTGATSLTGVAFG